MLRNKVIYFWVNVVFMVAALCFVDYNGHMNGENAKAFSEAAGKILKVRK